MPPAISGAETFFRLVNQGPHGDGSQPGERHFPPSSVGWPSNRHAGSWWNLGMASLQEFLEVLADAYPDEQVRGKKFEPFLRDALVASPSHNSATSARPATP